MINTVTVFEDRCMIFSSEDIGIIGENNAEILRLELPEKINGADIPEAATWKLLTENATNGYVEYEINGDFAVPEELTADSILHVSVGCFVDDEMIWKTYPYDFTFANGLNVNAESIVRNSVLKSVYTKLFNLMDEYDIPTTQTDVDKPTMDNYDGLLTDLETDVVQKKTLPQKVEELRQKLIEPLPRLHFEQQNVLQTVYTLDRILSTKVGLPEKDEVDLKACSAMVDEQGQIRVNEDGMPIIVIITYHAYTQADLNTAVANKQTQDTNEIIMILNTVFETTEYSGMSWSQIKTALTNITTDYNDLLTGMEEILGITEVDSDE